MFKNPAFLCFHLLIWCQQTAVDYYTSDSYICHTSVKYTPIFGWQSVI